MRIFKTTAIIFSILFLSTAFAFARGWQPSKPIKVYVGLAAGGGVDTVARVFTNKIAKNTGWTLTVINKTGGGGSVALKTLMKEKADGHAIAFTPDGIITFNPILNPNLGYSPEDFTPLAAVSNTQMGLICMADKPWNTFADAVAAAKSGEKVSVAYQAVKMGLMTKVFEKEFGVKFTLVPVKGGSAGMKNLLGKHVDIAWGAGVQAKYVKAGQMKVLASVREERLAMAPDAPTMKELGVEQASYDVKFMFAGPKGMPEGAVNAIAQEIKRAAESDEIKDLIANKLSLEAVFVSGSDLKAAMDKSLEKNRSLIDSAK